MTRRPLIAIGGMLGAATFVAEAANRLVARRAPKLRPAIDAPSFEYCWDVGRVHYARAGEGAPILLLHSHNAAASSYEVRKAFHEFTAGYEVFAPDLPGYGMSKRPRRAYYEATYVRFIHDFVRDVIGRPAIAIASSISAAHALIAAREDPLAFSRLVLVSPVGLSEANGQPPAPVRALGAWVGVPVWGQAVFNAITSRAGIRSFLAENVYHNPLAVTDEMVDYAWASSRQPGARYAPAGFLSGAVWADVRPAYAAVSCPLMVVWGDNDRMNPYQASEPWLSANPTARVHVIPSCGALPFDEKPEAFGPAVRAFLRETAG